MVLRATNSRGPQFLYTEEGLIIMKEMFVMKPFQPPNIKKWGVADDVLIFDKKEIPYAELSKIRIITPPSPLTNGVANVTYNGKALVLAWMFGDRERATQAINFANSKIEEATGAKKNYKYKLQAHTGTSLEVYENYIVIDFVATGTGFANILKGGGNGGKRINISDITAIQFKEPAGASIGFMQFTFPGSGESKMGVVDSINDENSVPVSPQNYALAMEIYDYIESRRESLKAGAGGNVVQQVSAMDELKKLKELLDMDIVTQEEFDAKKKQLLGL